ncbi:MAG TPA: efflux RND transporter periplasmic adaptor subunit [Candidatus Dormibacteraeota bacterium]|nr:efflux RND transporter periplasmic adaptor subunit [Candidatus Dormibacteraeota bacterium]
MVVVANRKDPAETPEQGCRERRAATFSGNAFGSAAGSAATRAVFSLLVVIIVAMAVIWGISSRQEANAQLARETQELAIPTVAVIHPKLGPPLQEIVLPGDMQAFTDTPIYARTNGYLKKWYVDIGAHVKTGELLATINSPEVDQQLQQARADLATAEANLSLAAITATRYKDLLKSDSVSQQDADNAAGNYSARKATVASAQSNVKRLQELQSFEKIYAPFDGVITARNTDIGDLIDSGSSGGTARELFHLAAVNRLRVYVNVPQIYSPRIRTGLHAKLILNEFPGRQFDGIVVRNSGAIDTTTRTLLTEIDVNNSSGILKPGAYVEVHLQLPTSATTYTIPVNATIFKSAGLQVAIVKGGKTISLIPITPGRDFGAEIEVVAGLKGDESVVINPPDSLTDGETVNLAPQTQAPEQGNP